MNTKPEKVLVCLKYTKVLDLKPAHYPEGWSREEMIAHELTHIEGEPFFFIESATAVVAFEEINEYD